VLGRNFSHRFEDETTTRTRTNLWLRTSAAMRLCGESSFVYSARQNFALYFLNARPLYLVVGKAIINPSCGAQNVVTLKTRSSILVRQKLARQFDGGANV